MEIIEDPIARTMNARQVLLRCKQGHGAGINLDFPAKQQIVDEMSDLGESYSVNIYGDGSHTSPTIWWAVKTENLLFGHGPALRKLR